MKDKNKHQQPMTTDTGKENNNYENGSGGADTTMNINTDENISGTTHLNDPMAQEDQVEKLENEVRELKDKYLRQVAEFENYKKRNAKERIDLMQTANKEVIQNLLVVLDDCDRAEKQLNSAGDAVTEGVQLVFNKLRNILHAKGLKPMQSIGTDFNPDIHEAITEIPAPQEQMKGKVIDELEKGYYLNDKIIRFAKVVVGK